MKLLAFIFEQPSYLNGVYHADLIGMTYGGTSTTHCADKLPCGGRKQIQIHTDSYRIIDFLRL